MTLTQLIEEMDYACAHTEAQDVSEQEAINRVAAFIDLLTDECNAAGLTDIRESF